MRPVQIEGYHLPGSVHTAIGPAGYQDGPILPSKLAKAGLECILNGTPLRVVSPLTLKPFISGAIVGEGKLVTCHVQILDF
jgi:hypothetical protein